MSKSPQYPVGAGDVSADSDTRTIESSPPDDLYPSFKRRHELREPLENAETSYYRAYPHLLPRRLSAREARRRAIREG